MKKDKKKYMVPVVTVVTFKTERGYALSIPMFALGLDDDWNDSNEGQETWIQESYSGSGWVND